MRPRREVCGDGMIETVRRQTLGAAAAVGMLIEIDLVQDQAGLTKQQQQREQEVTSGVKHRLSIHEHEATEYAQSYVAGKRIASRTRARHAVSPDTGNGVSLIRRR